MIPSASTDETFKGNPETEFSQLEPLNIYLFRPRAEMRRWARTLSISGSLAAASKRAVPRQEAWQKRARGALGASRPHVVDAMRRTKSRFELRWGQNDLLAAFLGMA